MPEFKLFGASVAALSLAACSSSPAYSVRDGAGPVATAPVAAPAAPISEPGKAPVGAVTTVPLAPPTEPVEETVIPPSLPMTPAAAVVPPVRTEQVTITQAAGPVIEQPGDATAHTVQPGEGLDAIARLLGTTRAQLAADNGLQEPFALKPGQVLKGPPSVRKAYVVQSGDTLYAISRRFGTSAEALAQAGGLETGAAIKPGQAIVLPSRYTDNGPVRRQVERPVGGSNPAPVPAAAPVKAAAVSPPPIVKPTVVAPVVAAQITKSAVTAPVVTPPVAVPPTVLKPVVVPPKPATVTTARPQLPDTPLSLSDTEIARLGQGRFIWPLKGDVISAFGKKSVSQANDGIDIGASLGTPVAAAAQGEVVYAGNSLPGIGNLVVIKHADGWVTAYAHLEKIQVKMRQVVSQGGTLGTAGSSGTTSTRLHFEVRYAATRQDKAKPVNPMLVLPR